MRVLIPVLAIVLFPSCAHEPARNTPPPTPSGYAYTEKSYPETKREVQQAGVALLRDILRSSSPSVPGEVSEGDDSTSISWVYSTEGRQPVRRRYNLSYVPEQSGTLVIVSLQEERKDENDGSWQPAVPNNATYHGFFVRLQSKIRKIR